MPGGLTKNPDVVIEGQGVLPVCNEQGPECRDGRRHILNIHFCGHREPLVQDAQMCRQPNAHVWIRVSQQQETLRL